MAVVSRGDKGVHIYNAGGSGSTTVKEIADMVVSKMGLSGVQYKFSGGDRGWKGDVPRFEFDVSRIESFGWKAKHDSNGAVLATLDAVLGDGK
jgi:UDP-glucose 4-epimerase